jgi:hypothetical protein
LEVTPLFESIVIGHGEITATTKGDKIFQSCWATFGFWDFVAGLKVPGVDSVLTPGCSTLGFKDLAGVREPTGFADGLGDMAFFIGYNRFSLFFLGEFRSRVNLSLGRHPLQSNGCAALVGGGGLNI